MLKGFVRLAAAAASSVTFLALTGCGGTAPSELPTSAPPTAYEDTYQRPELAGAPAPQDDGTGLLGGPSRNTSGIATASLRPVRPPPPGVNPSLISYRRADGRLVVAMRPVANPENMSPAERRRIYGERHAPRAHVTAAPRRPRHIYTVAPAPRPAVAVAPRPVVRAAPAPVKAAPAKPAPVKAPAVVAKAPKPIPVVKAPPPKAPAVVTKTTAPVPAVKAAPPSEPVAQTPAPTWDPRAKKKGLSLAVLAIPGVPTIDLPGVGVTPSQHVVAGLALLLLLALMVMASRASGARRDREERRRKFRTMTNFNEGDTAPAPEPDRHYVSPMLAAAGGAVAGAAAHSYFTRHDDDHGQAEDQGHHEPEAPQHVAHEVVHTPADRHEPEPA